MNNLLQIREKLKRANRLYQSQILATNNGESAKDIYCKLLYFFIKKEGLIPSLFDQFQIRI